MTRSSDESVVVVVHLVVRVCSDVVVFHEDYLDTIVCERGGFVRVRRVTNFTKFCGTVEVWKMQADHCNIVLCSLQKLARLFQIGNVTGQVERLPLNELAYQILT